MRTAICPTQPNLRFNSALQRLALSVGMNVVCASGAIAAINALPPTGSQQEVQRSGFAGSITLADDALCPGGQGGIADMKAVGSPEAIDPELTAMEVLFR